MENNTPTDFDSLRSHCLKYTGYFESVIEKRLLGYGARRNKFHKEFDKNVKRHKELKKHFPAEFINVMRAQYMYHSIFRKGGKISSYLKQNEVKEFPPDEFRYLETLSEHPSRFVFSFILEQPAPDFYTMFDLLTGEERLLYSPGVSKVLKQRPGTMTWFNLFHYNGKCYQSYGPVMHFKSFTEKDLIFIASYYTKAESWKEVDQKVQNDPFPYFKLFIYSDLPFASHIDDLIESCITEIGISDESVLGKLKSRFTVEVSDGYYRFSLPEWDVFPHYARLYYDSKDSILHLATQTERSFRFHAKILQQCGLDFDSEPVEQLSLTAVAYLNEFTNEDFSIDWYEQFFEDDTDTDAGAGDIDENLVEELNEFMGEIIPYINNNEPVPLTKIAGKFGIPDFQAKEIITYLANTLGKKIRTK